MKKKISNLVLPLITLSLLPLLSCSRKLPKAIHKSSLTLSRERFYVPDPKPVLPLTKEGDPAERKQNFFEGGLNTSLERGAKDSGNAMEQAEKNTIDKKTNSSTFLRIATNTMAEEGVVMIRNNKLEQARDHFEKVLNIDPLNPEAYYYIGLINFRNKHYRQSILFFKKAYSLYKGSSRKKALSLYQLGMVYEAKGNLKEAKKYFGLSRKEDPKNAVPDPLLTFKDAA